MPLRSRHRWFQTEDVGEVTVVRFPHPGCIEADATALIGEQLFHLVEDLHRCQLIINCENVESVDSAMLGKIVALNKKALAGGGRLALCQVSPQLYEVFATVKLPQVVGFYPDEERALKTFS